MIVKIGDVNFHVRWRYDTVEIKTPVNGRLQPTNVERTTCIISLDKQTVAESSIRRHYLDVKDKDKARKLTLGPTLRKLFPNFENKHIRRTFWTAYLNRKGNKQENRKEAVVIPLESSATATTV